MSELTPNWPSVIERLGRALSAQLSVITGERSKGNAIVRATGAPIALKPNTYAVPFTEDAQFEQQPVKVAFNPLTEREHKQGGEWTVTNAGESVTFISNLGGERNNWKSGTKLRFVPPVPGLELEAEITADGFTGGTIGPLRQVVIYDDLGSDISKAMFQGKVQDLPALVLAWMSSTPVEGRTAGLSQGATRKQRGARAYYENFALYTLVKDATSGETRRKIALQITEAARSLLGDHKVNIDGEQLSGMGTGVEIMTSQRQPKREQALPMLTTLRVISVRKRIDARTFGPWDYTRYHAFQEVDDEHEDEINRVDARDPMP